MCTPGDAAAAACADRDAEIGVGAEVVGEHRVAGDLMLAVQLFSHLQQIVQARPPRHATPRHVSAVQPAEDDPAGVLDTGVVDVEQPQVSQDAQPYGYPTRPQRRPESALP